MDLKQQNRSFTSGFKFLDLQLLISNGFVSSKIYAKRNNIDYYIYNFPFSDGEVPRVPSYGVYNSQLIRFVRVSGLADFNARNKTLNTQGIGIIPVGILRKSISGRHRPVRVADGPITARCRFLNVEC